MSIIPSASTDDTSPAPLTPEREAEIRDRIDWLDGDRAFPGASWLASTVTSRTVFPPRQSHVVEDVLETKHSVIRASVGVFGDKQYAEFAAHAREDVPALLAEVDRLRTRVDEVERAYTFDTAALKKRVAELEAARTTAAADRDKQIIAWLEKKAREEGTSNKDSRVRATAIYRLADKLSRGAVRPACPPVTAGDDDSHERKVAEYLATPYTDDGPRPRQFTPMQVLAHDVETAITPLTGDAKAGAEMVLRYIRTLAAEATVPTVEATS